jgi:signal transduction histidine kinase
MLSVQTQLLKHATSRRVAVVTFVLGLLVSIILGLVVREAFSSSVVDVTDRRLVIWGPWIAFLAGLVPTLCMVAYLLLARLRAKQVTELVVSLEDSERKYKDLLQNALNDLAERRAAEQALISAKEQADFANRSKSEFLANMSHELRTPLNAIIGFAEIIKDELFGPANQPQYVEYAKDIHDSGQLLLSLINDILDMSKIEAGKRELQLATVDIDAVIHSAVRLIAARAKENKVKLTAPLPPDLPKVKGEERALKQIITNLLSNAVKFTPEGGSVTVTVQRRGNGDMCVRIQDTGIGIKPEDIDRVMTPFGQVESALSRKYNGTGLGLPLTKALIELHGGAMELESVFGEGTTVSFTLPAASVLSH